MQIIMPKLGLTMTEGTITEWLKKAGDSVRNGDVLFTYETDKVSLEYEAPADGVLEEIAVDPGVTVPCGTVVCTLFTGSESLAGERAANSVASVSKAPTASLAPDTVIAKAAAPGPIYATPKARKLAALWDVDLAAVSGRGPAGRIQVADVEGARGAVFDGPIGDGPIAATPLARRMAAAEGIRLGGLAGSGPNGRVTRADVEAAIRDIRTSTPPEPSAAPITPVAPAPLGEEVIPLTGIRQVIAQRMSESAFTAPHVTLFAEAEATQLVSARSQLNQELPQPDKISYNVLLVALVAKALREHPRLNSRLDSDGVHILPDINMALAVDTQRGLVTPVLPHVDRFTLVEMQRGYNALIGRAQSGSSLPDDFAAGTFTITNLGAMDVEGFTPIINPPQAAILGVGKIEEKAVVRDGAIVARAMLTLSLSFDHRINDGAGAARFLQRIKQLVERPFTLMLA